MILRKNANVAFTISIKLAWIVFACTNVNAQAISDDKLNSSLNLKSYSKTNIDEENELIEKGYIFFPPKEKKQIITSIETRTNKTELNVNLKKENTEKIIISKDKIIDKKDNSKENTYNLPNFGNKKETATELHNFHEIKNTVTTKSKTINLDDTQKIKISTTNANYTYGDYSSNSILNVGIQNSNNLSNIPNKPSFTANGAMQLKKNIAIGFNLKNSNNRSDLSINTIRNIPDSNFYIKIAGGIMNGKEIYNFFSGASEVTLRQYNSLISLNYRNPDKFSNFKSIGINIWKTIAQQKTNFDPVYIQKETDNSYDIYVDPKTLALGNITGYSGSIKLKVNNSTTIVQSIGREKLVFPFSDGSKEIITKNYFKNLFKYRFNEHSSFETSISTGSVENKAKIEFLYSGLGISFEKSKGLNGLKDYWFAGVTYSIIDALNPSIASKFLKNYDEEDYLEHKNLLMESASRPTEFPTNFLAKIDSSSVKLINSIKKGLITWSSGGVIGTFFDSISPSRVGISLQLTANNSSNATIKYQKSLISGSLPPGLVLDENGLISGNADPVTIDTTYTFKVKATSEGAQDQISPDLSIVIKAPSIINWFSTGSIAVLNDSISPSRTSVSIQLDARNDGSSPILFDSVLASGSLPPGLTLNSSGLITGTTPQVNQDTTYSFKVNAHTSGGPLKVSENLSITIKKPLPIITWVTSGDIVSAQNCSQNSNLNISLVAISSSNESITYTLNSGTLPNGVTLSSDGKIIGTIPGVESNSVFDFTVKASTQSGASAISQRLSILKDTNGFIFNAENGHYYKSFTESPMTWLLAFNKATIMTCENKLGYLATITSNNELNFIDTKVYPTSPKPNKVLLGSYANSGGTPNGGWDWQEYSIDNRSWSESFYKNGSILNGYIAPWDPSVNPDLAPATAYLAINFSSTPKFFTNNDTIFIQYGSPTTYLVEFGYDH